jgi:hypothetical protein
MTKSRTLAVAVALLTATATLALAPAAVGTSPPGTAPIAPLPTVKPPSVTLHPVTVQCPAPVGHSFTSGGWTGTLTPPPAAANPYVTAAVVNGLLQCSYFACNGAACANLPKSCMGSACPPGPPPPTGYMSATQPAGPCNGTQGRWWALTPQNAPSPGWACGDAHGAGSSPQTVACPAGMTDSSDATGWTTSHLIGGVEPRGGPQVASGAGTPGTLTCAGGFPYAAPYAVSTLPTGTLQGCQSTGSAFTCMTL